ncbi:hypothetical protein BDZ97DRAFT_2077732 [Flammula alnicola]|nr:hypothetical protein BDZ97DRAFT_2077732 [Flammula alnicola]
MASPIVPTELIRPIIENITSIPTLYSLCLSSKLLRSETEPILYRSFTSSSDNTHTLFLTTIVDNQRLADLVRVFHSKDVIRVDGMLSKLTKSGLERMVGLKTLVFRLHAQSRIIDAPSLLDHCTFSLKTLEWVGYHEETYDEFIRIILDRQIFLKHLRWGHTYGAANLPIVSSLSVPNLLTFSAYGNTPLALLPGRRIRHLHWMRPEENDLRLQMSNIRQELGQLLSLWLNLDGADSSECFRLMAGSLSSLEFLGLVNPSTEDFSLIPTLPSLRVLVLSAGNRGTLIPADERPRRARAFFEMCPHLTRLDIVHEDEGSQRKHERWEGGTRNQRLFHYDEVRWTGRPFFGELGWPF